jgi:hypothetical protein
MKFALTLLLGLAGLAAATIAAEPEINDALLLRSYKRFPAADKGGGLDLPRPLPSQLAGLSRST